MIRKRICITAAIVVSFAVVASGFTSATATPAKGDDPKGVFVVRTGDQTWGEAMQELADSSDKSAGEAAKVRAAWKATSKGEPASVSIVSADGTVAPMAAAAYTWSDPNSWIVSGYKSTDKWYWQEMIHVIEGAYCPSSCTVTDRIVVKTTVNPGTTASQINSRVTYYPKADNFKTRKWTYLAICSGVVCGTGNKIDNTIGSVPFTFTGYGNRAGARLTIGVGITQSTVANTIQWGKKTADCLGRTGTDRRCKYIY